MRPFFSCYFYFCDWYCYWSSSRFCVAQLFSLNSHWNNIRKFLGTFWSKYTHKTRHRTSTPPPVKYLENRCPLEYFFMRKAKRVRKTRTLREKKIGEKRQPSQVSSRWDENRKLSGYTNIQTKKRWKETGSHASSLFSLVHVHSFHHFSISLEKSPFPSIFLCRFSWSFLYLWEFPVFF